MSYFPSFLKYCLRTNMHFLIAKPLCSSVSIDVFFPLKGDPNQFVSLLERDDSEFSWDDAAHVKCAFYTMGLTILLWLTVLLSSADRPLCPRGILHGRQLSWPALFLVFCSLSGFLISVLPEGRCDKARLAAQSKCQQHNHCYYEGESSPVLG